MENNVPKPNKSGRPVEGSRPSTTARAEFGADRAQTTDANEAQPTQKVDPTRPASAVGQAVDRTLEVRRLAVQDEVERLVSAAFRVIERTGHLEPKVSDILAEAGLSNQAFYRHFRSKHELLVAVLDEGIRGLARYLSGRMAEADRPIEAIRAWIRGMAAQAQNPSGAHATRPFALARGRLAESFPVEVANSEGQVTAALRVALEEARAAGAMPAVEAATDAEALYHLMMGWIEARLVEARIPTRSEVARLEAFILAGLSRPVEATQVASLDAGPDRERQQPMGDSEV